MTVPTTFTVNGETGLPGPLDLAMRHLHQTWCDIGPPRADLDPEDAFDAEEASWHPLPLHDYEEVIEDATGITLAFSLGLDQLSRLALRDPTITLGEALQSVSREIASVAPHEWARWGEGLRVPVSEEVRQQLAEVGTRAA
ncbi:MAG: hypothetical protein WKF50_13915 [Nocardioides sp.]